MIQRAFTERTTLDEGSPSPEPCRRPIPGTNETLPMIGCGTYRGFDVGLQDPARAQLAGVLTTLLRAENAVIDTSPMYGRAEQVTGDLLQALECRGSAFLATKLWIRGRQAGIDQMERSFALLKTRQVDLMQVHNLVDHQVHLPTLASWKAQGRIRYIGLTHCHRDAYRDMRQAILGQQVDFIQVNYSLEDRSAEEWLLPLAYDHGIAVLINLPFGGGGLLRRLSKRSLPPFATTLGCESWSQLLLKFVLGHPAVTSVIPGTGNPAHMALNMAAARGQLAYARDLILSWWLSA